MVRRRDRTQENQPPVAGALPRQLPVATAAARMARRPSQLLTIVREQGWRLNEAPATYEQLHGALLTGLLGNIGFKQEDEPSYLGARGIKFHIWPGSQLAKKAGQVDHGGRTGRYHAPVRALHRADPAGMAGARRRPPAEEILRRAALGKAHRAGLRLRARHAVRPGGVQPAPHRLRPDQSDRGARDLHPRCAGRRRIRHPRAVLRAQPEAGARNRKPRAQVAPGRRAGRRGTDRGVLRQADPGRHLQRHRLREVAQGRQRARTRSCCT